LLKLADFNHFSRANFRIESDIFTRSWQISLQAYHCWSH